MNLQDYITKVIAELSVAGNEIPGTRTVEFDIGIVATPNSLMVENESTNRIRFSVEVKRV